MCTQETNHQILYVALRKFTPSGSPIKTGETSFPVIPGMADIKIVGKDTTMLPPIEECETKELCVAYVPSEIPAGFYRLICGTLLIPVQKENAQKRKR